MLPVPLILNHILSAIILISSTAIITILLSIFRLRLHALKPITENLKGKNIMITGCDHGFGRIAALRLDMHHASIFALCLTEEGAECLRKRSSPRLKAFVIDITDHSAINQLCNSLSNIRFWALINNAGMMDGTYIDFTSISVYQRLMETNCLSSIHLTKQLLPNIQRGGRIVTICTNLSLVSATSFSAYTVSKCALKAFTEILRREMCFRGIKVSLIDPGLHFTNLTRKLLGDVMDGMKNAECYKMYGGRRFEEGYRRTSKLFIKAVEMTSGGDPVRVVEAISHAVISKRPMKRYIIGIDAILAWTASFFPDWVIDFILGCLFPRPKIK